MRNFTKAIELTFERTIPAPAEEVFDAWLDPKIPGNPWNAAERLILKPEVDALFYWMIRETAHYGRFTELTRPSRIAHTWVSPNTAGEESMVSVTFRPAGKNTVMTLVHSNLPDTPPAHTHEKGWASFLDVFAKLFSEKTK